MASRWERVDRNDRFLVVLIMVESSPQVYEKVIWQRTL